MTFTRLALAALCLPAAARADLAEYLAKPDKSFGWKLVGKAKDVPGGTYWHLKVTSQTWQGIDWKHDIAVVLPEKVKPNGSVFLWNTGGELKPAGVLQALDLATRMKAPVAWVWGVPNQPLFDGKKEDALIAETFVRYLKTKDGDWPLLFPMAKSVTRSMDAIQAFAKQEWKAEVKDFVVSGASKRGWTTWLTAAVDKRVRAIAPVVIDTLNMRKQMDHQIFSFGAYSLMIKDYTERKLVPLPPGEDAKRLWTMVDPYFYREKYTMPKLILNGTNDPYWTQDALNFYWDDLPGPKWVAYVPNAGHNVQQKLAGGKTSGERASSVLAAFAHCQIHGKKMPAMSWKFTDGKEGSRLDLTAADGKGARLWTADAKTRDFRESTWTEIPTKLAEGKVSATVVTPEKGFRVFMGEADFEIDGIAFKLTTQVRILGK